MPQLRMYHDLADLWRLVSPPQEYEQDAATWRDTLKRKLGAGRHSLLELGVGGGHNLSHLTSEFDATAVDLSPEMLANSKRLNPSVEHLMGDMRSVRLGRKFDAVVVHDAIAYMLTEHDLEKTFATARAHLEPGGVFVTEPDWYEETYNGPTVRSWRNTDGTTDLGFTEYSHRPDPEETRIETVFIYFIRGPDGLRVEQDRHFMGLFPRSTWPRLMDAAGFDVEWVRYEVRYTAYDDRHESHLLVGVLRG